MDLTKGVASLAIAGAMLTGTALGTADNANAATTTSTTTMRVQNGVTLNLRSGPGTSYSTKGSITGGTTVTGTLQSGWLKITLGAHSGLWVSTAYLTSTSSTTTPPDTSSSNGSFHGYILKTLIMTYSHNAPSTSAPTVRKIQPGTPISGVLQGDWLKTSNDDYVSRALITTTPLSNGNLPESRLCDLPTSWNSPGSWAPGYTPQKVRKLDCYAAKSLTGLENAYYAQFGRYARIDLAYRPLSEQYYWYNKFGYPRAAIPGTSNHGLGVAVDFRETDVNGEEFGWGGQGYNWLKSNGWKWGFRNTFKYNTWGESYHWDFEGTNY